MSYDQLLEPDLALCLHQGEPCPRCAEPLGMVTMLGPNYTFRGVPRYVSAYQCARGHAWGEVVHCHTVYGLTKAQDVELVEVMG